MERLSLHHFSCQHIEMSIVLLNGKLILDSENTLLFLLTALLFHFFMIRY